MWILLIQPDSIIFIPILILNGHLPISILQDDSPFVVNSKCIFSNAIYPFILFIFFFFAIQKTYFWQKFRFIVKEKNDINLHFSFCLAEFKIPHLCVF